MHIKTSEKDPAFHPADGLGMFISICHVADCDFSILDDCDSFFFFLDYIYYTICC
jgi:hypothetical protein